MCLSISDSIWGLLSYFLTYEIKDSTSVFWFNGSSNHQWHLTSWIIPSSKSLISYNIGFFRHLLSHQYPQYFLSNAPPLRPHKTSITALTTLFFSIAPVQIYSTSPWIHQGQRLCLVHLSYSLESSCCSIPSVERNFFWNEFLKNQTEYNISESF